MHAALRGLSSSAVACRLAKSAAAVAKPIKETRQAANAFQHMVGFPLSLASSIAPSFDRAAVASVIPDDLPRSIKLADTLVVLGRHQSVAVGRACRREGRRAAGFPDEFAVAVKFC